jgi:hypothetical protein
LKVPAKGRPKKPWVARTGRILSGFERTDAVVCNKRRKCGACHREGHIRTSWECPIKIKALFDQQKAKLDEILSIGSDFGQQADAHTDKHMDEQISEQLYRELVQESEQEPE